MVTEVKEERRSGSLKLLHETQQSIEKFRISLSNRVSAIQRGVDETANPIPEIYSLLTEQANVMEGEVDKAIAAELKTYPVWDYWLKHVKGIGPGLAGQMLALLLPPLEDRGPATWYKASGLSVEHRCGTCNSLLTEQANEDPEGDPLVFWCPKCEAIPALVMNRLPRPRKGEGKINYHPVLRRCLFNLATSFVRNGGYYRQVYEDRKLALQTAHNGHDEWPKHRIDASARWATVKLFLSHLWEKWLESEGGLARKPYVVEKMGHSYTPPPEWNGNGKI